MPNAILRALRTWLPIMGLAFAAAFVATNYAPFAPSVNQGQPSVREGSIGDPNRGGRTRYFVGGGLHRGK